jgi:hypothetical protein
VGHGPEGAGRESLPERGEVLRPALPIGRGKGAQVRMLALAPVNQAPLDKAREQAQAKLYEARQGKDPFEGAYHDGTEPTVRDLAERYMREHAGPKKSVASVRNDKLIWNRHVLPRLGKREVRAVQRHEVHRLLDQIAAKTPTMANRVAALLSKAFKLAELWTGGPSSRARPTGGRSSRTPSAGGLSRRRSCGAWCWRWRGRRGSPSSCSPCTS